MDERTVQDLLQRVAKLEREQLKLRKGRVVGVQPYSIDVGNSGVPYTNVPVLAGADLRVGANVAALMQGKSIFGLGSPQLTSGVQGGSVWRWAGPWGVGTVGPTTGQAINIPSAGNYLWLLQITAFAGSAGSLLSDFYIDGQFRDRVGFYFNQTAVHHTIPFSTGILNFTAGTHYFWPWSQAQSDAGDSATLALIRVG